MSHPYEQHKNLHERRVHKALNGFKRGGAVKGDSEHGRERVRTMDKGVNAPEMHGAKAKARADKYARGGRAKGGKTHINVNVMPSNPMPSRVPVPVPVQSPPPGAPPAGAVPPGAAGGMPPRPPMPPGAMPPGAMPGMRRTGGRAFKKGGRVSDGPAWKEGLRNGTKVQHMPDKDGKDLNRGPVITKKGGGSISGEKKSIPQPKHGAGSGLGRKEKVALQKRIYP